MKEMPRKPYQTIFSKILNMFIEEIEYNEKFENDTFSFQHDDPYDLREEDPEFLFHYKPTGFKMKWYKYPLRNPEWNFELNEEDFTKMLVDCDLSLKNGGIRNHVKRIY